MKKGKLHAFFHSQMGALLSPILLYGGLFFLLSLTGSMILSSVQDPTRYVRICSLAVFLLTGGIGSLLLGRNWRDGGLVTVALGAILFLLLLLLIGLVGSGGKLSIGVLMNDLCFLLTSLLFGMLGCFGRRKKRRRR